MPDHFLEELFGLNGQGRRGYRPGTGVLCGAQAQGLAKAGARVVVAGRDPAKGAERVKAIEEGGGTAAFLPVDVMKRDSIENLLKQTIANFGRVDMLINGAGVNSATSYFDVKDEDWDRVINSNLKAVHWGCADLR